MSLINEMVEFCSILKNSTFDENKSLFDNFNSQIVIPLNKFLGEFYSIKLVKYCEVMLTMYIGT